MAPQLDASPQPSQIPSQTRPRGGMTFAQPDPQPETSDQPNVSPSPSGEPRTELPDSTEPGPTSSPGSSGSPSVGSKRVLRDAVRSGVMMAGGVAHQLLARDQAAIDVELYVVDAEDAEAIGDPLANIANRRGGIGIAGNPDLADAISCLIGLALYAAKQIARFAAAREYRRALSDGSVNAADGPQSPDRASEQFKAADGAPAGSPAFA